MFIFPNPKHNSSLSGYLHRLILVFAMMLYKPIVSLIVAIAAASSTAASATPLRRGNGYYPPPQVPAIPLNECNANSQAQCCNSYTSSANPAVTSALQGLNLLGLSDTLVGAGLSCKGMVQVAAGATW